MTVSTAYAPLQYAGNGATTSFSVTWPFLTGSLVVTLVASTGVETVQTLGTHYTVTGGTDSNGLPAVGTVGMITAPASGATLRITRSTPKTQASTWGENDRFPQKTIEAALDKLTLAVQESGNAGTVNDGIGGDVMELVTSGATDYWDAQSQIIRNVASAVDSTDAVNYGQLQAFAIATGAGDVVGPSSSVDDELALFDSTTGKLIKRATTTGLLKAASGVVSAAVAGTDYVAPGGALGTPSSGTLTNATGLPISTGVSGLGGNVATFLATPSTANLNTAISDTVRTAGKETIFVPSGAMTSRTTNGAASGTTELATNDVMLSSLDFDQTTEEGAGFWIAMPKSWNESTVTFKPFWTAASGSGGVVWGLAAYSFSDDDAMDTAVSGQQTSTDTLITANDMHIGPESSAITIGGTPAEGDMVYFEITREVANGSDTLSADAKLLGVHVYITTNASTDA
jgi:hypothetical protein